jgi:hypothetical protein
MIYANTLKDNKLINYMQFPSPLISAKGIMGLFQGENVSNFSKGIAMD